MPAIFVRRGREKSILQRHPWIFSGSVERVDGSPQPGETVQVNNSKGDFLAWAAFSPISQIRARIWSWDPSEKIDASFFEKQFRKSIELRERLAISSRSTAYRLIYANQMASLA